MNFKVTNISGPSGDCECCGFYSGSGTEIHLNDELIWRKYFDGHMGGESPEQSVLNAVINAWNESNIATIEANFTEEKRHEWNKSHPGNGIARMPESWKEHKEQNIEFQKESFDSVKEACAKNLPHDEVRQVKMIVLWIEEYTGEKIQVIEDNHYESDGNDDEEF